MARWPWFWRAVIACSIPTAVFFLYEGLGRWILARIYGWSVSQELLLTLVQSLIFFLFGMVVLAIYSWLTHRYGPRAWDGETRCRKCGYILRGIPEPRCSECGERI